ncbi:Ppx/GppA family phosphatase [Auraticoccus sp. F435]|uniref:Ppx/GppA family phosphatase n=1 Tax=Auraticoccus cholistanensis TaxID=2656650 RepID=A0A6A9UVY3_9ACTN|nr:Ppx/GppA phosphatase family protein [Auraticoccus cholistanensis]MVA77003.1 Ppx/GppA family phosphatase [Auraticoccus cholistanensis]
MRLGVLDVGSNTVHLLVVDARAGRPPVPATSHSRELRLAEHMDGSAVSERGIQTLVETVRECQQIAERTGCARMLPFVTSALREADNCDEVIEQVRRSTGVELEVLSGTDEARWTFLAARRWLGWSAGSLAVLDIGGGSLELAAGRDEYPDVALSVPVGAGRMSRRFAGQDVSAMRTHVRAQIGDVIGEVLRVGPFERAVGTSKTFRSLARITGAAPRSEGPYVPRRLKLADVSDWVDRLAGMKPEKRASLPGVSEGRSTQILAGAVVAEAAMELGGFDLIDICPWALREGVILNYLDHLNGD